MKFYKYNGLILQDVPLQRNFGILYSKGAGTIDHRLLRFN